MSEQKNKVTNAAQRAARTRSTLHGTAKQPRLSVAVSNMNVTAQLINDDDGTTIASASTIGGKAKGSMTEKATVIGQEIAKAGKAKKISKVIFDRGGKQYHGRVKALADAARENGLEF